MKREFLKGFTMFMLIMVLALATAAASNAQSVSRVVADIPFEFSVGFKTLPAGEYAVKTITSANYALMVQSSDGKSSALRLSEATNRAQNAPPARMIFHRYGERYFLAEVWNGEDTGRRLLQSDEEQAIARELRSIVAKNDSQKTSYEVVEILATVR